MTPAEIDARALKVIRDIIALPEDSPIKSVQDIQADTPLEQIDFSSLEIIETVMALEEEFGIEVPDKVIDETDFATVGDLMAVVRKMVAP